jgi:integrase
MYRGHLRCHIVPRLGAVKLAKLTTPAVEDFGDQLLKYLSPVMAKKIMTSLKMLLKDARRRGTVAQNVASDVRIELDKREKLTVGREIPTREEIRRILDAAAPGQARAYLITAALTGMRASELRGLTWANVDLTGRKIFVRQRADKYRTIGNPKSKAGTREIPLGDMVVRTLREWRLQCPKGDLDLVFPNKSGTVADHANLVHGLLDPAEVRAGVVDSDGKPKYGLHCLRHFYASWCINRKADGGLGLPPKTVQERLGHSSITMTLDVYGHLFPSNDDGAELAEAEARLFAV